MSRRKLFRTALLAAVPLAAAVSDAGAQPTQLLPIRDAVNKVPTVNEVSNAETAVAVGGGWRFEDGVLTFFGPAGCQVNSVSADGSVMVGRGCAGTSAFRWEAGVFEEISVPGVVVTPTDVSADGSVIVGTADPEADPSRFEAFRWTAATGIVGIGDLPGGDFQSQARGVSADGRVVVGEGENSAFDKEAFRWEAAAMQGLGELPGGDIASVAGAASGDGTVVVGASAVFGSNTEAFRWTAETGMLGLGAFPGANLATSSADDISADGRIIVGEALGPDGRMAFVHDPSFGMRPLARVLENEFGLDTSPWAGDFEFASAISDDGRVIGGTGKDVRGGDLAFLAVLPHPPGQFGCNVELDAEHYADGETVQITTLRYANFGPAPLSTRLRLLLEVPQIGLISIVDRGADGSFALPSGLDVNLAPVNLTTVQPQHPRGVWALRCVLVDASTGHVQAEDRFPFELE